MVVSKINTKRDFEQMLASIDGQEIEWVWSFIYLSSYNTDDGWCKLEIRKRIGIAKSQLFKLRNMLTNP